VTDGLQPFIAEIRAYPYASDRVPRGWARCDGQLLSIAQNTSLFNLIGTTYGGDGITTFALPDLRGRMAINQGQAPGLSSRVIGEEGGSDSVTLIQSEMPAHSHPVAATGSFTTKNPGGAVAAPGGAYGGTPNTGMSGSMLGTSGGTQPHQNMQPYLALNWCIALEGIVPQRPS
jgi:microcystin-dependent protein